MPTTNSEIQNALSLAIQHHRAGRLDEAIAAYERAIAMEPGSAELHNNLGMALRQRGRFEVAIGHYQKAIALRPDLAEVYNNLGIALRDTGQIDQAISAHRQAVKLKGSLAGAWHNLGIALIQKGQFDEAIDACARAVAIDPNMIDAHVNLGAALVKQKRFDEAIPVLHRTIALSGNLVMPHNNLGKALLEQKKLDEAVAAYRRALEVQADFVDAHWGLALSLLTKGDFANGLPEHEWRFRLPSTPRLRDFEQPMWTGSDLRGKTILIHAEQGYGDNLQFVRYLPLCVERGARVILECLKPLRRLFDQFEGTAHVVTKRQPLLPFDVHSPVMSLPLAFGTTLDSIPADVPYLHADAAMKELWRERLGDHGHLRVGLVWGGRIRPDPGRSIPLQRLAPLADFEGVKFVSLQMGPPCDQLRQPPPGLTLLDMMDDVQDFADTAALIANLDLVISIDSAVAHLAGAMGKPTWLLLPYLPHWRWLLDRDDSPWYPSMRLFRQTSPGDWPGVAAKVARELRQWAGSKAS
jgi:Flp pilus assembly protein TadD